MLKILLFKKIMAKCSIPQKMHQALDDDRNKPLIERWGICDTIHMHRNNIPFDFSTRTAIKILPNSRFADKSVVKDILFVMEHIAATINNAYHTEEDEPYIQQRTLINDIFRTSSENYQSNTISSIVLRLVVLDSLYSTNASYSYFSFENMAKAITKIGKEDDVLKYFDGLISRLDDDSKDIFSLQYGIRKNLGEGSRQMSLMTKYAYYQLMQKKESYPLGFPIYDSLVVEAFPQIYYHLFKEGKSIEHLNSISEFIKSLDLLRNVLFPQKDSCELVYGLQQFDLLDAYLWRMGKINGGNYSLLFNENDYKRFIENIGLSIRVNYGEYLFEKFRDKAYQGKPLVKRIIPEKTKNAHYKYDFNSLVRYQCTNMSIDDILLGISNGRVMRILIEHWIKYFNPLNDYIK